jgi:IstB-like ATP binding protein
VNRDPNEQLRSLGLRHTADVLDDIVALATKNRWGAHQVFEHVARIEVEDRARRGLERRLGRSKLGKFKPMADFDWAWPKRIDREAVESASPSISWRRPTTSCSSRRRGSGRR